MSARKKRRNPWIFLAAVTVGIMVITCISILVIHPAVPGRIGVAIVGDPTVVFSFDPVRNAVTAVSIPSDVSVDLTRGYGTYPVSSVWKLDSMDKRQGLLYTETMEETIGFPVRFYIRPADQPQGTDLGIQTRIVHAFSVPSLVRVLFQSHRTNIPPWLLFKLLRVFQGVRPTDMTVFDLQHEAVFTDFLQPDGSTVQKIDGGKLTLVLGTQAEDAQIRKEHLRIALYNTTNSPGLAQKLARVIEETGFHVVTIANLDGMKPDECIVRANHDIRTTSTVQTLLWLYGCSVEEETQDTQSDVTFIIGTDFEKRFLSF